MSLPTWAELDAALGDSLASIAAPAVRAAAAQGYAGGELNRQTTGWRPANRTADREIAERWWLLTARGRWLGRNNPWCIGARGTIVDNIIGEGIQTRACVRDAAGVLLRPFNRQADDHYARWMDGADSTGRQHWHQLTRTNFHQVIEAGEGLLLECADPDPNRLVPICFEALEPDRIDCTRDRPSGDGVNEIRRGIEFDARGRRVAYYLYNNDPHGGYYGHPIFSTRVPAWRVIHVFAAQRPSQTRGVTWFAPIVKALWDSYEYMQHEISAAKVASFFVYMWKREQAEQRGFGFGDENGEAFPSDAGGNGEVPLGPGIGLEGGPNDSFEVVQSNRPNGNAVPWLRFMLQMMGAGLRLSFQRFTGDFSQTTFSSARAADLQDRKGFGPVQQWHAWYVDLEVRRRVTRQLIAAGELPVPAGGAVRFDRAPHRWLACKARPPGWGYIDPQKQVEASKAAIGAGLSTWERELANIGLDRDDVFETLAQEIDMAAELGLPLEHLFAGPGGAAARGQQPGVQPEPDEENAPATPEGE
jgi:lambda family phage portal protein